MLFAENLTDRQAADAVRSRTDWKYALGLALCDPGFDFSILSRFRTRLVTHQATGRLFEAMLTAFARRGWISAGRRQRTDSTHILAAIRSLTRLELVGETVRHALETLAREIPAFLQGRLPADWLERYGQPLSDYRLPQDESERMVLAEAIGKDGRTILSWIYESPQWQGLRVLSAIQTLRQVWVQQFYEMDGQTHWRSDKDTPHPRIASYRPMIRTHDRARSAIPAGWDTNYI